MQILDIIVLMERSSSHGRIASHTVPFGHGFQFLHSVLKFQPIFLIFLKVFQFSSPSPPAYATIIVLYNVKGIAFFENLTGQKLRGHYLHAPL